MKMVKKILLGLATTAIVLGFAGCKGITNSNADTSGLKTNKTITVDASDVTEDNKYKRAFVQLGTLEQVQSVKSTITFTKADVKNDSVVGYAFDLNFEKDSNGNDIRDKYNFVLFGYRPSDGKYYLERYKNVSMTDNQGLVSTSAMGDYISYTPNGSWGTTYGSRNDWHDASSGMCTEDNGVVTMVIEITQATAKTYQLKVGSVNVGSYTRGQSGADATINLKDGKAEGGIALYANAKKGAKFSVTCKTENSDVTGNWNVDTIE